MGHLHLNVSDAAATRHFWVDVMGATPFKLATLDGVRIPGAIILFKPGHPTGPISVGSVINHVGVTVNSLKTFSAKLTAAGFVVEPGSNPKQVMVNSPDGMRVELTEDDQATVPIANHHIHWNIAVAPKRHPGLSVCRQFRCDPRHARQICRRGPTGRQSELHSGRWSACSH